MSPLHGHWSHNLKFYDKVFFNPIALRKAKIVCNFGLSECNRAHVMGYVLSGELFCMQTGLVLPGMHACHKVLIAFYEIRSRFDVRFD